jgi:outer membrane receptor protein involved in Fe transport
MFKNNVPMNNTKQSTEIQPVAGRSLLFIFILISALFSTPALSQQNGKITGQVTSTDGKSLPFASVTLQREDGQMFKGTLSDTLGVFAFTAVPNGKYQVKVSIMGFNAHQTKTFLIHAQNHSIDLGRFSLSEDAVLLNSVTIRAEKRLIEQSIDRTVINVENSILSEGNTALELLERAPGVSVSQDGEISLKGRTGVLVMLNGKNTYLSPKELSTLLKGTNSNSISKIEIMGNPSAKYDAAGNAGIINIQMKKNMGTGFNGAVSVNGGAGRKARYGSGINLNYRMAQLNVYGSYDYGYRGETEYLDFVRRFYENGVTGGLWDRRSYQDTKTDEPLHTNNFRVGIDYELNKRNSIGFLLNGNIGKYTHDSKTNNLLLSQSEQLLSQMSTTNYDQQNWKNLTYNLNYLRKFAKEGRTLTADADFASNRFTSKLNLNTKTLASADGQPSNDISRKGYVPAVTDVYVAKIDYTDPVNKTIKLETGLKSSFTSSDNNLRYELLNNGSWEYDSNGSNHFKYDEQIHAGYLNFNIDFSSFSVQAGLRAEHTQTEGHQITTDSLIKRNYFQLFPSLFINKPLGENHQLQAAFSRRIERPDYGDLNPFRVFRDPLLFYQGNPFLKPEMITAFQISHSFKSKYTTALSYNRTRNVITWISGQIDALNTTFEMPENLSKLVNYGISFTASTSIFPWWTGTHFANVFRNKYSGTGSAGSIDTKATSFSFNSQNTFKTGKGYTTELNGLYNGASVYGISRYKRNYMISAGIQKTVLRDKGTLKLTVNDIFQSRQLREVTQYGNIDMNTHIRLDSRRGILSFSYRFGNQSINKKERRTGSEDIMDRVKGGG